MRSGAAWAGGQSGTSDGARRRQRPRALRWPLPSGPPPPADPATLAGLPDTRRPPEQLPRGLPEPSRRAGQKPAARGRVADGRGDRARQFLPRETGLAGGGLCVRRWAHAHPRAPP